MNSRVTHSPNIVGPFSNAATLSVAICALAVSFVLTSQAAAHDGCVQFDIPSVVPACEVTTEEALLNHQRFVEIVIPMSSLVGCDEQKNVQEMMVRVHGLGSGMKVVDYAPRTQLYSQIEGTVTVETRQEKKGSIGINGKASGLDVVQLSAEAGTSHSNGTTRSYQKRPDQKLLLASGTINRGNGVYFKFKHSPQTTLEGGHTISLTMQVPDNWRGGMLRIDCLASGTEKYLLGESDFEAGADAFVVSTYLKGDIEAKTIVEEYTSLESRYEMAAVAWQSQLDRKHDKDPIGKFLGQRSSDLPDNWQTRFMLLDTRSIQSKIKPHLPKGMQNATQQFLVARRNVLRLGQ